MTDEEMTAYLRDNGYPEHIVRAGRAGLIDRWGKFVAEVEHGYQFGLEDYRNDLDLRGIIAMLGLDAEVRDLDRRFEKMLTHRDKRVWESSAAEIPLLSTASSARISSRSSPPKVEIPAEAITECRLSSMATSEASKVPPPKS